SYSPREKTIAARMVEEFIPEEVKERRLEEINSQNKENCYKSNEKYVGRVMEVLIDSFYEHKGQKINTGRTRNNKIVHIPHNEDLTGQFLDVKITGLKTWYLKGELNG
ncbi:TRAM domain-containing protein, partial [bacterium]|nr:TRAM domain-containing protein [bacterium]